MSTPDAASADVKPIFAAALQGNLSAITANIADANASGPQTDTRRSSSRSPRAKSRRPLSFYPMASR